MLKHMYPLSSERHSASQRDGIDSASFLSLFITKLFLIYNKAAEPREMGVCRPTSKPTGLGGQLDHPANPQNEFHALREVDGTLSQDVLHGFLRGITVAGWPVTETEPPEFGGKVSVPVSICIVWYPGEIHPLLKRLLMSCYLMQKQIQIYFLIGTRRYALLRIMILRIIILLIIIKTF